LLVSIVTPTLNQATFITATLDSVRAQTHSALEHIVVDGGSTDGTHKILASRRDDDPRLSWVSEPDGGMYEAVNKGLRRARGEVLGYLNSDDALAPWALEAVVAMFTREPDVGLVYGDAIRFYEELEAYELLLQPAFKFAIASRTGSFVQPAVFWRRSLYQMVGAFDESLRLSADLDYWLRASRISRPRHIREVLAIERAHGGGQTSRATARLRTEASAVRARFNNDHQLRGLFKLAARVGFEGLVRLEMVRYAFASIAGRHDWRRFRLAVQPRIAPAQYLVALLTPRPLAGTPPHSLRMRLLRGRWIRVTRSVVPGLEDVPAPN
jgi:glycosyltransferase involved in cell wall biosynthesis